MALGSWKFYSHLKEESIFIPWHSIQCNFLRRKTYMERIHRHLAIWSNNVLSRVTFSPHNIVLLDRDATSMNQFHINCSHSLRNFNNDTYFHPFSFNLFTFKTKYEYGCAKETARIISYSKGDSNWVPKSDLLCRKGKLSF